MVGTLVDARSLVMAQMRARGDTLQVIATRFDLTRERVRQVLAGTDAPTGPEAIAIRATQRDDLAAARRHQVVTYLGAHPGSTTTEVAAQVGVPAGEVRAVARAAGCVGLLAATAYEPRPRYTDEDIFAALRAAAVGVSPGALTVKGFDRWRTEHGALSVPLVCLRFGSWLRACELAGVKAGKRKRAYTNTYGDDACLDALAAFLTSGGKSASVPAYTAWSAANPGTPSAALIRLRLGTWTQARTLAQGRIGAPTRTAAAA